MRTRPWKGEPVSSVDEKGAKANRLIREKSPYLLQHAHNPVDWYPWGQEAFAKAKSEDKPVFLSIGYSTCYWCHVMEKESFENAEVAETLNRDFIAIKVDREERPDLDAIYMNAVVALSGQGGWPMSVFLTPEGKPFWGGTYFPPEDYYGRPGFKHVLTLIADGWKNRREEILKSSSDLVGALQHGAAIEKGARLSEDIFKEAVEQFEGRYEETYGGFGRAPKFPSSHNLSFLLRAGVRTRKPSALRMVEHTLDHMARGGMHDQLGGGFHRYSTDEKWLVPHFEKMLYDQALLARTYLEAYQATGKAPYAEVARDILDYVLRDMTDARGGFYSAEDAGEVGQEGEFYVWQPAEVKAVLGEKDAAFFSRFYDVTEGGNFEHGASILHVGEPLESFAKAQGLSEEEARARLASARARMLAARAKRTRPHRDDKVLTDWNGLMISAFALGGQVLGEERYAQAAKRAADFILANLMRDGGLLHRYRDGEAAIPGYLDDFAFLTSGLLDLYGATFEVRYLAEARRLALEMVRLFWDAEQGGFFMSGSHNEQLVARTKEGHDGALPSGNAAAALGLAQLGQLTMDRELKGYAEKIFEAFSGQISRAPAAFPVMLSAFDFVLGPSMEIVIAGEPKAAETRAMLEAVRKRFLPRALVILRPGAEAPRDLRDLVPFVKDQKPIAGKTTAYVCKNYACNLPTSDLQKLLSLLN